MVLKSGIWSGKGSEEGTINGDLWAKQLVPLNRYAKLLYDPIFFPSKLGFQFSYRMLIPTTTEEKFARRTVPVPLMNIDSHSINHETSYIPQK